MDFGSLDRTISATIVWSKVKHKDIYEKHIFSTDWSGNRSGDTPGVCQNTLSDAFLPNWLSVLYSPSLSTVPQMPLARILSVETAMADLLIFVVVVATFMLGL